MQGEVTVGWSTTKYNDRCTYCSHNIENNLMMFDEIGTELKVQAFAGITNDTGLSTILVSNNLPKNLKVKAGQQLGTISSVLEYDVLGTSGEVSVVTVEKPTRDGVPAPTILDSVQLPEELFEEGKEQVMKLLSNYVHIFGNADEFRPLRVSPHRIELTDYTPIYQRPRRFPEVVNQEIEKQCEELCLQDIIESSKSAWSSPVVPIRKKDGTIRLCVDYRRLNSVTKADRFPLPNLSDAVFGLHGVRYLTSLDLRRGYYQLPLEEESRKYTAFSTPRAHFQFKRLSFGLKNAPAAFQREMQNILSGFPWQKVIVYIDDVLILSESFEEHLELVEKVIKTLSSYGVTLNIEKCKWCCREVEFLGHVVSNEGLSKQPGYVKEVENFPKPATVKQLRQFLGLVNFQRKFIPNCSILMKPLSEVTGGKKTKRQTELKWTEEMESSFIALKIAMAEAITLAFPDYSEGAEPLSLFTDASGVGIGACLSQKQDGQIRPIAFASLSFNSAEQKYSTLERELAAIRWAVRTFRSFLFGVEFVIHTDHQPLVYLYNMHIVNSRLARTLQELSEFNFVIKYTPGRNNIVADTLSRIHDVPNRVSTDSDLMGMIPKGLVKLKDVPGGGDSLIQSLIIGSGSFTEHLPLPQDPMELRNMIVTELMNHPDQYRLKKTKSLNKELRVMSYPGHLLCMEALLAFSHLFQCVVLVHYGGDVPVVYAASYLEMLDDLPRLHLQCISGIHFNPLVETTTYKPPMIFRNSAGDPHRTSARERNPSHKKENDLMESGLDCSNDNDDPMELATGCVVGNWCSIHSHAQDLGLIAMVNKVCCCILFDTGAQISCVSEDLANRSGGLVNRKKTCTILGVGNKSISALGEITLNVEMPDGELVTRPFFVVPNNAMHFCLIFGIDIITSLDLKFNFENLTVDHSRGTWRLMNPFTVFRQPQISTMAISVTELSQDGLNSEDHDLTTSEDIIGGVLSYRDIVVMQDSSMQMRRLRRLVETGQEQWRGTLKRFSRYRNCISVQNNILLYSKSKDKSNPVPVVPFSSMVEVVLVMHYKAGHPGRQKLLMSVLGVAWHPGVAEVVADATRTCEHCQKNKVSSIEKPPITKIMTAAPFELVAVDLVVLPKTRGGLVCCLVAIDHNSKWLSVVPLSSKTASSVSSAMRSRILPVLPRIPERILSDNGPEFISKEFKSVLQDFGIRHTFTTPYKPSSNGLVERVNRTVLELLRNLSAVGGTWIDKLPKAVILYNTSFHTELCMSPSEYLLKEAHKMDIRPVLPQEEMERLKEGNPSFASFRKGQKVLRKVINKGRLTEDKLTERFVGPYEIVHQQPNGVSYIIKDCETGVSQRAHHVQLKKFHFPPSYILKHPCFCRLTNHETSEMQHLQTDNGISPERDPTLSGLSFLPCYLDFGYDSRAESSTSSTTIDTDSFNETYTSSASSEDRLPKTTCNTCLPTGKDEFFAFSGTCTIWTKALEKICKAESELESIKASYSVNESGKFSQHISSSQNSKNYWSILQPNDSIWELTEHDCLIVDQTDDNQGSEPKEPSPFKYSTSESFHTSSEGGLISENRPLVCSSPRDHERNDVSVREKTEQDQGSIRFSSLASLDVSLDRVKDVMKAVVDAPGITWLPRHLAALDLAPTTSICTQVHTAVRQLEENMQKTRQDVLEFQKETAELRKMQQEAIKESYAMLRSTSVVSSRKSNIHSCSNIDDSKVKTTNIISTRSRGPVADFPHVQPVTLEYKKRKPTTSAAPSGEE